MEYSDGLLHTAEMVTVKNLEKGKKETIMLLWI